jgi:hypothetical protein
VGVGAAMLPAAVLFSMDGSGYSLCGDAHRTARFTARTRLRAARTLHHTRCAKKCSLRFRKKDRCLSAAVRYLFRYSAGSVVLVPGVVYSHVLS